MREITLLSFFILCLSACDTAPVRGVMVKSDQPDAESRLRPLGPNTYQSSDKLVELEITLYNGMSGSALIDAVVVNKRNAPIFLNLDSAVQLTKAEKIQKKPNATWFDGCFKKLLSQSECMFSKVEIASQRSKKVRWYFTHAKEWELIIPIESKDKNQEEVRASFKVCDSATECDTSK